MYLGRSRCGRADPASSSGRSVSVSSGTTPDNEFANLSTEFVYCMVESAVRDGELNFARKSVSMPPACGPLPDAPDPLPQCPQGIPGRVSSADESCIKLGHLGGRIGRSIEMEDSQSS